MKKYIVTLTNDERESLGELASRGKHGSQEILNALILLGCDEGEFQEKRSTNPHKSYETERTLPLLCLSMH